MFHYCSGIFIILILWGHNFFLPFPFSLPQFTFSLLPLLSEFSWKCFVFLHKNFMRAEIQNSGAALEEKGRDGTDKQGHKAGERRADGRELSTCSLKSRPNATGGA